MLIGIGIGLNTSGGGQKPPPPNTLIAGRGVFFLTGDTMGPEIVSGAAVGSFTLTGIAATFAQGTVPVLTAGTGAFTLTGIAASLLGANQIAANLGSFVETGVAAGLNILMPAAKGTFALTGVAATLSTTGGGDASQTTAFLARADALSTVGSTERAAYKALINGLVSDGVFAKLDTLYVAATDTSAHGLLNLISSSFNSTITGSVAFVADLGFSGAASANIDTGFVPSTAGGNFTLNSASMFTWVNTAGETGDAACGADDPGIGFHSEIYPAYLDGNTYMRLNDGTSSGAISTGPAGATGLYLAVRDSSTNRAGYFNGSSIGNANSTTSGNIPSISLQWCAANGLGADGNRQQCAFGCGGALTSADAGNLYSRLRTYMTAVGVP